MPTARRRRFGVPQPKERPSGQVAGGQRQADIRSAQGPLLAAEHLSVRPDFDPFRDQPRNVEEAVLRADGFAEQRRGDVASGPSRGRGRGGPKRAARR